MMRKIQRIAGARWSSVAAGSVCVPHRRAGSVFEYYFAYMLLTSLILSAAGICIHLMIKAFDEQSNGSRYVHSALSVSRQLRSDDDSAVSRQVVEGRLLMALQSDEISLNANGESHNAGLEQVEWRAEKCVLVRRSTSARGSVENRFVFPLGTTFRILVNEDQHCVVLVRDPLPPNLDLEPEPLEASLADPESQPDSEPTADLGTEAAGSTVSPDNTSPDNTSPDNTSPDNTSADESTGESASPLLDGLVEPHSFEIVLGEVK